jgi:peptidoglycan glycosyltransferase
MNPLHLMMIAGCIAADGSTPVPYFIEDNLNSVVGNVRTERLIEQTTASQVKTMMRNNVINNYGDSRFPDMEFGGKTGTAQVAGEGSHAWFMGFSTDESFPYAVVVLAENGGGGSDVAVPIASKVMKELKNSL